MEKNYHTSVVINGQKILPSDTFILEGNEYILLDIFSDGEVILHIACSSGDNISKEFYISLQDFESKNQQELSQLLQ